VTNKQTQLFFFFAGLFILSITLKPYPMSWLVKLIPMSLLIFYAAKQLTSNSGKVFIAGMIFSAAGDFFLDYDRVNWFIFGLGAFFIAHVCYLFALKPLKKQKLVFVGLYALYGIGIFSVIAGGLGELFIPVLAYMSILLLMAITTLLSIKSNKWLIIGGLSFVLSDSLIGLDKFYQPIAGAHFFIMLSYYFAQYALFKGFLLSEKK
jgi:uncharacterized membrane protein YhhN